jgi:protein-S-isoprenylcysteine O-methyltransferase Ste14
MQRTTAAVGSVVFFLAAPAVVAGYVPWRLTRWQVAEPLPGGLAQQIAGSALATAATAVLIHAFYRFVVEGIGTPAPVAPTKHLVVGGLYRFVRNPMYLAVLSAIIGQALVFGQRSLVVYAGVAALFFVLFVHLYEEPTLRRRFGEEYAIYCSAVPAWWPRFRPRGAIPERCANRDNREQ